MLGDDNMIADLLCTVLHSSLPQSGESNFEGIVKTYRNAGQTFA
jgi:hypothetical protein